MPDLLVTGYWLLATGYWLDPGGCGRRVVHDPFREAGSRPGVHAGFALFQPKGVSRVYAAPVLLHPKGVSRVYAAPCTNRQEPGEPG